MTDGDVKRHKIFDVYSKNLETLMSNELLQIPAIPTDVYICPICKDIFSRAHLEQIHENPLSLEDAPPKSLGGKAKILTCKRCNNTCGEKLDYHLAEQMVQLDRRELKPGIEFQAQFENNGKLIQGTIKVGSDGQASVIHEGKNNNPVKLEDYVRETGQGDVVQLLYKKTRVDPRKIQLGLLKTAYLLAFEKYGYSFILNSQYDRIRKQLLNPDDVIYPLDFWFNQPLPSIAHGTPFLTEKGLESILVTFILRTQYSSRMFSAIIPITTIPIEKTIQNLKSRFSVEQSFSAQMDAMSGANYLQDVNAIKKMLDWMHSVTNSR